MRRSTTAAVLACAALAAAALGAAAAPGPGRPAYGDDGPPSPLIFGAQRIPLTFSHAAHLRRSPDLQCIDCHDDADSSTSAVDRLIPDESACEMCHPIDRSKPDLAIAGKPPVRCVACHPGFTPGQPVARVEVPTPAIKFSHAAHETTACKVCHGDKTPGKIEGFSKDWAHKTCKGCHTEMKKGPTSCKDCHKK